MVTSDKALDLLKGSGMSGYEAKAYVALLGAGEPLNGYEVAKLSGVPRSTVYETLGKLVARGFAFQVSEDDTVSYVPLPADALVGPLAAEQLIHLVPGARLVERRPAQRGEAGVPVPLIRG